MHYFKRDLFKYCEIFDQAAYGRIIYNELEVEEKENFFAGIDALVAKIREEEYKRYEF